ncbi:YeeE/YedE thiosulfate transporter family protein [Rhodovulum strictum]|uniref:YeeE/YedE family protein n=1 Tax=Rhodovulum strictum TaxID=58314 RepID=A0A844B1F4_9RHOB|nr:YeeE/YedE thiosulfate transporter family protein [Rhodovulum strictum]MRH19951.1 YeeE/YedE family protein [Rhodovulum strictum]
MEIALAIGLGALFGLMLERIGATDPNWVGRMLSLVNMHLMKTILVAIGTASILMFGGQMLGLVEVGHMSVKEVHVGVLLGGAILGIGWAMSGYCPGTGVCAAATGRFDALFFIVGGLVGAGAYALSHPFWENIGFLNGEKWTIGAIPGSNYPAALPDLPITGDVIGIGIGVVLILVAILLPRRLSGKGAPAGEAQPEPAE